MRKSITFFTFCCILLFSCDNSVPTTENSENSENNNSENEKTEIAKLNKALKKYEEPLQLFKIATDKPSVITGQKGTKISINPNDLITESGKPIGKNIEVELVEIMNQGALLRTNTQTVSDGNLIVSGGAYYIGMTSNDEQLKLKQGKALSVQFPKISDIEMELFYGQRNEFDQMNWKVTTESFKTTEQVKPQKVPVKAERKDQKSEIDAIFDYVESGDTTTTKEERVLIAKRQKNEKLEQKLYDAIGIEKFGWINCDRFLIEKNIANLYVNFKPQDSIKFASVFLIFKDINSVVQEHYYSNKLITFENLPSGYKVQLIAYSIKDEKVFAYTTDLTIVGEQKLTINLEEISEKEFRKLIIKQ